MVREGSAAEKVAKEHRAAAEVHRAEARGTLNPGEVIGHTVADLKHRGIAKGAEAAGDVGERLRTMAKGSREPVRGA